MQKAVPSVSLESPNIFPSNSVLIENASLLLEDVTSSLPTKEILNELPEEIEESSKMLNDSNVSFVILVKEEPVEILPVSLNGNPTQLIDHSPSLERIQVNIIF